MILSRLFRGFYCLFAADTWHRASWLHHRPSSSIIHHSVLVPFTLYRGISLACTVPSAIIFSKEDCKKLVGFWILVRHYVLWFGKVDLVVRYPVLWLLFCFCTLSDAMSESSYIGLMVDVRTNSGPHKYVPYRASVVYFQFHFASQEQQQQHHAYRPTGTMDEGKPTKSMST
jgi:hypothetical protein